MSNPDWVDELPRVKISEAEFDELLEYSTTLPTGKTVGKTWKRQLFAGPRKGVWLKCTYITDPDPSMIGIYHERIEVIGRPPQHTYTIIDSPKMLRETLCVAQQRLGANRLAIDERQQEHMDRLARLIEECDRKRPLVHGKHDSNHTPECGCD